MDRQSYTHDMDEIAAFYNIENFASDAMSWYELWQRDSSDHAKLSFIDLLQHTAFYPAVKQAIVIFVTLPATTCTAERSFSTLRRVKTWVRSTMGHERVSGLCMLSAHRDRIEENKEQFMAKVMNEFGRDRRRLETLFEQNSEQN